MSRIDEALDSIERSYRKLEPGMTFAEPNGPGVYLLLSRSSWLGGERYWRCLTLCANDDPVIFEEAEQEGKIMEIRETWLLETAVRP